MTLKVENPNFVLLQKITFAMKKLKLLLVFSLLSFCTTFAQLIVDGVNVNEQAHVNVLRMSVAQKFMSGKVNIFINYGQSSKGIAKLGSVIRGEDGKPRTFDSAIAAWNYIESKGWEYLDSYYESFGSGTGVHHYHFRRKKE